MEAKSVKGTDNFFHCLATCRAKKNGSDPDTIKLYTDMKENRDYLLNLAGKYGDGQLSSDDMIKDMNKDKAANKKGLDCPDSINCEKQCMPLLNGLPIEENHL
jgi:hypothetical protein